MKLAVGDAGFYGYIAEGFGISGYTQLPTTSESVTGLAMTEFSMVLFPRWAVTRMTPDTCSEAAHGGQLCAVRHLHLNGDKSKPSLMLRASIW